MNDSSTTADNDAYLDAWQSVDSDDLSAVVPPRGTKEEGVPLAVAKRVFGKDPKPIIEELNEILVA